MTKTLTAGLSLFAGLMYTGALFAGESSDTFNTLDKNGNGQLSAIEASDNAELINNWSEIDKDGNRVLDRAEFAAFETTRHTDEDPAEAMSQESTPTQ